MTNEPLWIDLKRYIKVCTSDTKKLCLKIQVNIQRTQIYFETLELFNDCNAEKQKHLESWIQIQRDVQVLLEH